MILAIDDLGVQLRFELYLNGAHLIRRPKTNGIGLPLL